jgi:GNAT superfamily N-acetyltransferase
MLDAIMRRVERGEHLPAEPPLQVVAYDSPRAHAVCAFTGLSIVAAPVSSEWVHQHIDADDLSAPLCPPFLTALAAKVNRKINNVDIVMLASARVESTAKLRLISDSDHPRVRRARRYRDDVLVHQTPDGAGVLILGRGVAGRWEVAVEIEPAARGTGLGRALAAAAPGLVPEDRPVWAQIAPGNAASVRAFLAAGFRPVGAETLLALVTG